MSPFKLLISASATGPQFGRAVHGHLYQAGLDYVLWIEGGEAHIGAADLGPEQNLVLGPHKEGPLAKLAQSHLAPLLPGELLVVAGIHFDQINKAEIGEIPQSCQEVTQQIAASIPRF